MDKFMDIISGAYVIRLKQNNDKLRNIINDLEQQRITKDEARRELAALGYKEFA